MRPVLLALLLTACGDDDDDDVSADGDADSDTDADSDADSDTDADTDADADADADADGDADPPDAMTCSRADPAWVFCSDFEEGDFSQWDDYDGNPAETNTLVEEAGPYDLAANHVGRLRVPAGRGGADFVKVLPDTYDRLYARWWIQYEPGFDFDAPNHGGGLHAGSRDWLGHSDTRPNGDDWFSSWIEYEVGSPSWFQAYTYSRGMYQDCVDPGGSCWGDHYPCTTDEGDGYCERAQHRESGPLPEITAGRWMCVEMMMDAGTPTDDEATADGQLDFWVDGQEIGPWTDLWLRTTPDLQLSILWLSLFHHEDHSVEGVLYDDAIVSTERIGCDGR